MPHPIYGPPEHKLHRVEFKLELPARLNNYQAHLTCLGYASTKRATLWSTSESFECRNTVLDLAVVDVLQHVALVAIQDRPTTSSALELGLRGGAASDPPPPLF